MKKRHVTTSPKETKDLAGVFAKKLKGGEVVALVGDLGAGKTTFVQGLANALGVTVKVKSPTFTLLNVYPTDQDGIVRVVHMDGYRLKRSEELGQEEYAGSDTVTVTEWPKDPAEADWLITFSHGSNERERSIEIQKQK